jgi:hypothetical protein
MKAKEEPMPHKLIIAVAAGLALAACNEQPQPTNQPAIKVRNAEQDRLHTLDAMNLAIALKRAIYDAGYTCRHIDKAGFVGAYQNLDQWTAHCTDGKQSRDWAIFTGPDGSAQVRDCKDLAGTGIPACVITKQPQGSFGSAS